MTCEIEKHSVNYLITDFDKLDDSSGELNAKFSPTTHHSSVFISDDDDVCIVDDDIECGGSGGDGGDELERIAQTSDASLAFVGSSSTALPFDSNQFHNRHFRNEHLASNALGSRASEPSSSPQQPQSSHPYQISDNLQPATLNAPPVVVVVTKQSRQSSYIVSIFILNKNKMHILLTQSFAAWCVFWFIRAHSNHIICSFVCLAY